MLDSFQVLETPHVCKGVSFTLYKLLISYWPLSPSAQGFQCSETLWLLSALWALHSAWLDLILCLRLSGHWPSLPICQYIIFWQRFRHWQFPGNVKWCDEVIKRAVGMYCGLSVSQIPLDTQHVGRMVVKSLVCGEPGLHPEKTDRHGSTWCANSVVLIMRLKVLDIPLLLEKQVIFFHGSRNEPTILKILTLIISAFTMVKYTKISKSWSIK